MSELATLIKNISVYKDTQILFKLLNEVPLISFENAHNNKVKIVNDFMDVYEEIKAKYYNGKKLTKKQRSNIKNLYIIRDIVDQLATIHLSEKYIYEIKFETNGFMNLYTADKNCYYIINKNKININDMKVNRFELVSKMYGKDYIDSINIQTLTYKDDSLNLEFNIIVMFPSYRKFDISNKKYIVLLTNHFGEMFNNQLIASMI